MGEEPYIGGETSERENRTQRYVDESVPESMTPEYTIDPKRGMHGWRKGMGPGRRDPWNIYFVRNLGK